MNNGYSGEIVIRNSTSDIMEVFIEPWGDKYQLRKKKSLIVKGEGGEGVFEIAMNDQSVSIHGWAGSTVSVFTEDGKDITIGSSYMPAF
ncbi:hypothetical protein KO507_05570 [Gilvimarinus agarilyticus]|uniref:hypothetical protein n=1 Tax=Gilvimarinus sp. 2_MG-2023 TaxID=3062666 RepID=UPI001C080F28|nr:hypothetical protein [Gilvimarinus sp. 2_MG-2023]MBU2885230.1 hypothetical protein [Gilvimarinus agarilyticus]MDO6570127.1 hypothetical protein [Gilvimarinus sp. 2_MG-2023]